MSTLHKSVATAKRFGFFKHPEYEWHYGPEYGLDVLRILTGVEIGMSAEDTETLRDCLDYLRGCKGEEEVEDLHHPLRPVLLQIIDGTQLFGIYDLLISYLNRTNTPRSLLIPLDSLPRATSKVLQLDHPIFGKIYHALSLGDDISGSPRHWQTLALKLPKMHVSDPPQEILGSSPDPDLLTAIDALLPEAKSSKPGRRKGRDPDKLLEMKRGVLLRGLSPSEVASRITHGPSRKRFEEEFERKMKLRRVPEQQRPA